MLKQTDENFNWKRNFMKSLVPNLRVDTKNLLEAEGWIEEVRMNKDKFPLFGARTPLSIPGENTK